MEIYADAVADIKLSFRFLLVWHAKNVRLIDTSVQGLGRITEASRVFNYRPRLLIPSEVLIVRVGRRDGRNLCSWSFPLSFKHY